MFVAASITVRVAQAEKLLPQSQLNNYQPFFSPSIKAELCSTVMIPAQTDPCEICHPSK